MKVYDAASIRNVAIAGHTGSGKTQLASAILSDAGMVNRFGKVDEGTAPTDFDDEEIARKHTLSASLACAEWNRTKINLIDTPGMANFLSEARAALRVADAALVVVDAVSGVEVSTEKVWAVAEELEIPRLVVLNRLDRERASLERSLESLRGVFGRTVVPIQLPIGEEKAFRGIVDLVGLKAYTFTDGKPAEAPVPSPSVRELIGPPLSAPEPPDDVRATETLAPSAPVPVPPTPAAPRDPVVVPPTRVVIHHGDDAESREVAQRLADQLRRANYGTVEIKAVPLKIGSASVRFFHAADRLAAQQLVNALGPFLVWQGRAAPIAPIDFTDYRPLPSPGSLEIWLPRR